MIANFNISLVVLAFNKMPVTIRDEAPPSAKEIAPNRDAPLHHDAGVFRDSRTAFQFLAAKTEVSAFTQEYVRSIAHSEIAADLQRRTRIKVFPSPHFLDTVYLRPLHV
ncbi:MAG TPA: hypothetical protein P5205_20245, partial [Candidatus Paceibacterota bacterium]|nr:hypothetical protein [Verrucomicrobiota bacterium]HSA12697.1 hypothetical protein [Candidatus Paceibacterota bacterium]